MIEQRISVPRAVVAEFCQKHHIRRLSLFGSVLRDDFRPDSDIDILVEFEPGYVPSLLRMAGLELELSGLLERKVDLRTALELSRYFRQDVIDNAQLIYELS